MNEEKENKSKNSYDEQDDKKKISKKRLITIIIIIIVLIIDIVLSIIFIPKLINKMKNKSSSSSKEEESSYVVSDATKTRYTNMATYINKVREENGYDSINDIVSLQYMDKSLFVSYQNATHPGYIKIELVTPTKVDEALEIFDNEITDPYTYVNVINECTFNEKSVNVSYKPIKGISYRFGTTDYISFTCQYNDSTLASLTQAEYNDGGLYENISKATISESPSLYDIYWYILNK